MSSSKKSPKETFFRINDYTIAIRTSHAETHESGNSYEPVEVRSSVTRSFNFLAGQILTVTRDVVFQIGDENISGSSSISTNTHIQNFSEVENPAEIERMHQKLAEMGAQLPSLETVLPARRAKAYPFKA